MRAQPSKTEGFYLARVVAVVFGGAGALLIAAFLLEGASNPVVLCVGLASLNVAGLLSAHGVRWPPNPWFRLAAAGGTSLGLLATKEISGASDYEFAYGGAAVAALGLAAQAAVALIKRTNTPASVE